MSDEINNRIITCNKADFANIKLIITRLLTRTAKVKLCKALIKLVVTFC